jgi:outer membrane receptor for ferrienterochelin and colicins
MRRRWLRLSLLSMSLLTATSAAAHVAVEAQFFDAQARRAYAERRYDEALEAFLLVQEIAPSPSALYNGALCADLAGKGEVAFALYREYLQSVDADEERRGEAQRRLRRLESSLALLELTSEPAGAAIFVDRKELGQYGVTPRMLGLEPGTRQVQLEHKGYAPVQVEVVATVGVPTTVQVTLDPIFGDVEIDVVPKETELQFFRDEKRIVPSATDGGLRLPVGSYTVVASAPGFLNARVSLLVQGQQTARLVLGLQPLPKANGRLLVSSGSVAAELFVDGQRVAVTPVTLPEVSVGEHQIEVRYQAQRVRRTVIIEAGRALHIAVDLVKQDTDTRGK